MKYYIHSIVPIPDSVINIMQFMWNALLDFVFPPTCILCHAQIKAGQAMLCQVCEDSLKRLESPLMQVCDLKHPPPPPIWFESSLAIFQYQDDVKTLVHSFKYRKTPQLAGFLGKSIGRVLAEEPEMLPIDVLAPVPLHSTRFRERGYNQSALLAQEISRIAHIPVDVNLLKRDVPTKPQAEKKSRLDRVKNVQGAFSVKHGKKVQNACIAVVDDVVTTGSTINECARVLRNAGAARVIAISISRVE